jgi:hypothetical protein
MSIGGLSFIIMMRAIAHGDGFRLECNLFNNNGTSGRIFVKAGAIPLLIWSFQLMPDVTNQVSSLYTQEWINCVTRHL